MLGKNKKSKDSEKDYFADLYYSLNFASLIINRDFAKGFTNNKYVIYVEDKYNEDINKFILQNFKKIKKLFSTHGKEFIYIPFLLKTISQEQIHYYNPQIEIAELSKVTTAYFSKNLFKSNKKAPKLKAGFISYGRDINDSSIFNYFILPKESNDYWQQFEYCIQYIDIGFNEFIYEDKGNTHTYREMLPSQPNYPYKKHQNECEADNSFSFEAQQLVKEIKERIDKLKQIGINEFVLKSLFSLEEDKLSHLIITKDYKIVLPDYNNLEIKITPLPKAVYFLFLKHPLGIVFKHLPFYKQELLDIYLKISNRENYDEIIKSIDNVIDPTKNAINEKCSRIREAFIKEFDESIAQYYFITGQRLDAKKILLNRDLVIIEGDI